MLQEIKELQTNAITELHSKIAHQKEITFKAPTGSGKTFMMADLMNRCLADPDIVFIVSSLSKAGLGKQNYEKFLEYKSIFVNLNPYLIKSEFSEEEKIYIPENYNIYVLPRDLYKDKARIKSSGAFLNLLMSLNFSGKRIYLIKDECHIATNNLNELNDQFVKILNFSATPKFSPDVEITNEQAVNAKLIKHLADESDVDSLLTVKPDATVEEAIDKFLKVKEEYINKLKVNPCLIIQISNKEKAEEEWARIKKIVTDPTKNLKWMYIVDENNGKGCDTNDSVKKLPVSKWKDYVKNNESLVDIIIFKMVITEGWDIPRACMLYQVRDSKSKQMDEQVVGRVRRNPILLNWEDFDEDAHELALTSWVWGLVDGNLRKFKKVNLIENRDIEIRTTKLNSLTKNSSFNLKEYVNSKPAPLNTESIFDLHRKWNKCSPETVDMCWPNISSYEEWIKISTYLNDIDVENNSYMENYDESLVEDNPASFPKTSYFETTGNTTEISNWAWELNDTDDEEYHFDSGAEREFAKILKKLGTEFWGKNFYPNSNIKFEYVLHNKHSSYPDFILRDKNKQNHIIEVKSVNNGGNENIDKEKYNEKVVALRKMFIAASKVTSQYFYLPLQSGSDWIIYKSFNGVEETLNKTTFIDFIKSCLE